MPEIDTQVADQSTLAAVLLGESGALDFQKVLDKLPAAAYTCDADGLITYFNSRAVEVWGRAPQLNDPADRYCGSFRLFDARSGEPLRHDQCWMARALRDKRGYNRQEIIIEQPDGRRLRALAHANPIADANGKLLGALNVLVDLSEQQRAEDTEQRFAQFMEHLPGLAWIKNAQGQYVFVNGAAAQAFGRRAREVLGKTDQEIFPAEVARRFAQNDREALGKPAGIQTMETLQHADGATHYSLVSKFPIPGGAGAMVGGIAIDMTDRVVAAQTTAHLAQIVAGSDDAIISIDPDGLIASWNLGAERLYGYAEEEAVGRPISLIFPPENLTGESAILERVRRGERLEHYETVRLRKDGSRVDVSLTVSPVRNPEGKVIGAAKIARDISARKRAEEALRDADRRKDEFLAMLSHELRNPLAPLSLAAQMLGTHTQHDAAAGRLVSTVQHQVDHMVRLIDELMDISRISRGKIELRSEDVDLHAVLDNALEFARPHIEAARHRLNVSLPGEPLRLHADPMRLAQILTNLLNNAAKYTPAGGEINLSAELVDSELALRVRDNGRGIADEMLPHIFELFAQGKHATPREAGGLGVGLFLARGLAELHGGSLTAHSAGLNCGAEFTLRLPIAGKAPAPVPSRPADSGMQAAAVPEAVRALVVDDNHGAANMMGIALRTMGAVVRVAYDGASAIEMASEFRPEIVLMDIGMTGMDGHETVRRMRADPQLQQTLMVAVSGWGQKEMRERSQRAGFDHHLVKPVDLPQLRQLLAQCRQRTLAARDS